MVTGRLLLRPWCLEDLEDFHRYARDPEVGPNAGWKPHENMEESRRVLETFVGNGDLTAVVLRATGRMVGSIGLHPDRLRHESVRPCRELGYVLSRECWGVGLMTEAVRRVLRYAFEGMGLSLVSVAHFPGNERSEHVIRNCGFRYEKTLRGFYRDYRGAWRDEVCYGMTRKDYFAYADLRFFAAELTADRAAEIRAWRGGRPAFYPFPAREELSSEDGPGREGGYRAVLDESGALCGFFRLFEEKGALLLCPGMKPELCGQGLGERFLRTVLADFRERFPDRPLGLEVRAFDRRARACCRRAGFEEISRSRRDTPMGGDEFIRMRLPERVERT